MLFISVDGEEKRVAHTSGIIAFIGKEPIDLPVDIHKGLKQCAMESGCVPFDPEEAAAARAESDKDAFERAEANKRAIEEGIAAGIAAAGVDTQKLIADALAVAKAENEKLIADGIAAGLAAASKVARTATATVKVAEEKATILP